MITLWETLIPTLNQLCWSEPRQECVHSSTCRRWCVRGTHALYHVGLPGYAQAPMVRIPKVKDSLSNRSGRRRRLLSFHHVPRLLNFSLSYVLSRLSSFSTANVLRKVLTTWRIILNIPHCIIRLIDEQLHQTLAKKKTMNEISLKWPSLCEIISMQAPIAWIQLHFQYFG